jgi:glucose/arabinose dehydrogenase
MVFANDKVPPKYRGGAFVAFHGSSHRAPLPEDGYLVAFVPFKDGIPSMDFEVFADGFAGAIKSPGGARSRPAGLALGSDGSLYVSDDKGGRIWRITYKGK